MPNVSSHHCVEPNNGTTNVTGFVEDASLNVTLLTQNDPYAVAPPEDYFLHQMLGLDKEIHNWDNVGEMRWQMVLGLFGGWVIVCLSLIKGVQSSGKVT